MSQAPFVLDASVALAWCFGDEQSAAASRLLEQLEATTAVVPALWRWEIGNALLAAERRGRLQAQEVQAFLRLLERLPIEVDPSAEEQAFAATLDLARSHGLTTYDAAYLELAKRRGLELATRDAELREAALAAGIAAPLV